LQEATEYGACGVGILVALNLTNSLQVERSVKSTGIDYWVGTRNERRGIFQRSARLEISGILEGDASKIASRLQRKFVQIERSRQTGLPAYVVIIDFKGQKQDSSAWLRRSHNE
jgi:hypothetical protein